MEWDDSHHCVEKEIVKELDASADGENTYGEVMQSVVDCHPQAA